MIESPLQAAIRKAEARLVWFLMLLYFCAVLDRVNVGVAGVTMRADLHLSAANFGFGAGVFFLGYVIFEVPSNLLLARFGARLWLARIAVTWGLAAMAVAAATGAASFGALRFLLGIAEAGFFPGVIFALTLWFPARERARINAIFLLGVPLSNAAAAALSSILLRLDGALGLAGWQWLFILEGMPPVVLGVLSLRVLADGPARVAWLSEPERQALTAALDTDRGRHGTHTRVAAAFRHPVVWLLGLAYFGINISLASLGMWLPQLVHALGRLSPIESGLVAAIVLLPGALVMFLWSRHSDARGERVGHLVTAALLAGFGWALSAVLPGATGAIGALAVAAAGTYAALSLFWTLPAALLSGPAAAAGIALIGTIGNLGGFFGPWAIGLLRDRTGGFAGGFLFVAVGLLVAAAISGSSGRRIFAAAGAR